MMMRSILLFTTFACSAAEIVVVSGATGRSGLHTYQQLKQISSGTTVRALVRNATKAKDLLNCSKCDASEGVFVGDVKDPASLRDALRGADRLIIATASTPYCNGTQKGYQCINGSYTFHKGAWPVDIDYHGTNNQVDEAVRAGVHHVLLISTFGTTSPEEAGGMLPGHDSHYKLVAEAYLMNSAARGAFKYTIVKPTGLMDTPGGQSTLEVGHQDRFPPCTEPKTSPYRCEGIPRADVASALVQAVVIDQNYHHAGLPMSPSANVRFVLTTDKAKPLHAPTNFTALFMRAAVPTYP